MTKHAVIKYIVYIPGGRKSSDRKSTDSRPASEEEYDTADNWSTASVISEDPSGSLPEEGIHINLY